MNELYKDLIEEGITNVNIIAIGQEMYSSSNYKWLDSDNILPVVIDPTNDLDDIWGAEQWDLFFFDDKGNYIIDLNIKDWDYDMIYNQIKSIIP